MEFKKKDQNTGDTQIVKQRKKHTNKKCSGKGEKEGNVLHIYSSDHYKSAMG